MVHAICSFEQCQCKIINLDSLKKIELPQIVMEQFQIMELGDKTLNKEDGNNTKDDDGDKMIKFALVNDIWDFDNIGVSRNLPADLNLQSEESYKMDGITWRVVKCVKYLVCADCDKGPIGIICQVENEDKHVKQTHMLSLSSIITK